jgi:hypothetical protein
VQLAEDAQRQVDRYDQETKVLTQQAQAAQEEAYQMALINDMSAAAAATSKVRSHSLLVFCYYVQSIYHSLVRF